MYLLRMLRWARGKTQLVHVRNVDISKEAQMCPMAEFLREKRLRWFGRILDSFRSSSFSESGTAHRDRAPGFDSRLLGLGGRNIPG